MDVKARNVQKFEIFVELLAHPVETPFGVAYMPLFLTVSEIYGRKFSKW